MGTCRQLPDGRWRAFATTGSGEARQRRTVICETRREARGALQAIERELERGQRRSHATLGGYLAAWIEEREPQLAAQTVRGYRQIIVNHLTPALGRLKLDRLTADDLAAYFAAKRKAGGLSETTLCQHRAVLHKALVQAVKRRTLSWNPLDAIEAPKPEHREMTVLTGDEPARRLDAVSGTRLHLPVLLALACGLRRGEVLGLQWRDLDLDAGMLSVERSLEWASGKAHHKVPKTRAGRRQLMLPNIVSDALRDRRHALRKDGLETGRRWREQSHVCPGWHPDTLSTAYGDLARRLALSTARFHDLRHTHATMLAEAGAHPRAVQERLGHSTISVTLGTYSHVMPSMRDAAVEAIQKRLGGGS